jgi:tetratricopeptide (TPR) repeat protein
MGELVAPNFSAAMLAGQTERRTGVFTVRAEQVETRVYVAAGSVVFAVKGALGDTLGRVLVREGKLTGEQYEVALKRMMRAEPGNEPMRFGEALVALRFLSGEQVCEALAAQVRQRTIRCLTYPDPDWSFEEGRRAPGHFPSRAGRLILAAARTFEPERIGRVLDLEHERYPKLGSDSASAGQLFEASASEQSILNLIDGAKSTRDLIALAQKSSDRDEACAVLAAAVQTGVAKLSLESVPSRAAVRPLATPPKQQRAAAQLSVGEMQRGSAHHGAIKASASTASAASAPADPRTARLEAEQAFQNGKRLLDRGEVERARIELDRAAALCPEVAEFGLTREWAEFLANANDETRSEKLSVLKRMASAAVKQDPSFAFGCFVLGRVAALEGLERHGIRLFRQALKLDPRMTEAERYLRLLTVRATRPESSPELAAMRKTVSSSKLTAAKPPLAPPQPPQDESGSRDRPKSIERLALMIKEAVTDVQPPAPKAPPPARRDAAPSPVPLSQYP